MFLFHVAPPFGMHTVSSWKSHITVPIRKYENVGKDWQQLLLGTRHGDRDTLWLFLLPNSTLRCRLPAPSLRYSTWQRKGSAGLGLPLIQRPFCLSQKLPT